VLLALSLLATVTACTTTSAKKPSGTTAPDSQATFAPVTLATTPAPTTVPIPTTTIPPLVIDPGAASFHPTAPSRLLDTHASGLALPGGAVRRIPTVGFAGFPASGPAAVALNVTITNPDDTGVLTVWASGTAAPATPSLSVSGAGDAVGKLVITTLGPDGELSLRASVGMDVAIDLVGWFTLAPDGANEGRYVRGTGARLVDSRRSLGTPGPLPASGGIEVPVLDGSAIPPDAAAVVLKVSLFEAVPVGEVTLWPTGSTEAPGAPAAAQVQVPAAGWTATNIVIVRPGAAGRVSLRTTAATGLSVDLLGWFTGPSAPRSSEGLFVPLTPPLALDVGPLDPPYRRDVTLRTAGGLPTQSGAAVFADVLTAEPSDAGEISITPARTPKSEAARVAVQGAGSTTVSAALVDVGEGDRLSLSAAQHVRVGILVRGYVIGRPTIPDAGLPPEPATPAGTPPRAEFDRIIEQLIASTDSAGASVTVAKDGRIIYARSYGLRDVATSDPMRVDSRFRYASMTKVITAATLLQLVQAGGIGLDDPVFPLLAERVPLPSGHDPRLEKITVRQLLSHTSGLRTSPDVFFNEQPGVAQVFGPGGPTSCESAAQWFVGLPLKQEPGLQFDYVNMNYCLAGLVIEALTGERFTDAAFHLALTRRGVTSMTVGRSHLFGPTDVTHKTPGVDEPGGGNFMENLGGAGALIGTPTDLVRFIDGLDPDKPGAHLLTRELYQQFTTVQPGFGSWGLGAEVFGSGSFGHSGSLDGARGAVVHRGDGFTYAITMNGSFDAHSSLLRDTVARAIATVPSWPTWNYGDELP
jgi:D-alanyl-D-alanine carboxypeptidase